MVIDVKDCSEDLLRQQSFAIKNQRNTINGGILRSKATGREKRALDARAGSFWHKITGAGITRDQ